jgi:hypothetical protein
VQRPLVTLEDRPPDRCRDVSAAPARVLGPGLGLAFGLGFVRGLEVVLGLVPDLGVVFQFGLGFVLGLVFVPGLRLSRALGTAPRAGRYSVFLTLELGHQGAHGA